MRTSLIFSTVLAVLGAATVTAATVASASPDRHPAQPNRFTVVERALTDTVADTGPKGDGLGDVLAFAFVLHR